MNHNTPTKKASQMLFIVFIVCISPVIYGQQKTLSVAELFELALKNSEELKNSKNAIALAEGGKSIAKSAQLPEIGTHVSYSYLGDATIWDSHFDSKTTAPIPHQGIKFGLDASQIIYAGGIIRNNIEKADLSTQLAVLNFDKHWSDIKLVLIGKYLDLYKLEQQQAVFIKNIKLSQLRLQNIQALYQEGMVTHNDITRSQLQLSRLQLNLEEIQSTIAIENHDLCLVLGLDLSTQIHVENIEIAEDNPHLNYQSWLALGQEKLPENKMVRLNEARSLREIEIQKGAKLPTIALYAGNELQRPIMTTSPIEDLYLNAYQVGVKLQYNLSSLYRAREKVKVAQQEWTLSQQDVVIQDQKIAQQIYAAYIQYQQAGSQIQTFRDNVGLAVENYEQIETKYFNQLALMVDMLDASNARLQAELELKNAEAKLVYTYYKLKRTAGTI